MQRVVVLSLTPKAFASDDDAVVMYSLDRMSGGSGIDMTRPTYEWPRRALASSLVGTTRDALTFLAVIRAVVTTEEGQQAPSGGLSNLIVEGSVLEERD